MEKLTVLILEDDPEIRVLLSEAMLMDGHDTVLCASIEQMRKAEAEYRIGLYLIDITLPDGDGLEIARTLRLKNDCGIVVVTGRGDEIDAVLALELGADDYIVKPFRVRELRARVKSVVRRLHLEERDRPMAGSRQDPAEYIVQGLLINPESRSVRSEAGEYLSLTTLEFDVLLALTSPPNRVLSRDQIMDKVRGPNWSAYDRSVDGLVSRLRTKLFDDPIGREKIKTIRGIGYMFCDEEFKKARI